MYINISEPKLCYAKLCKYMFLLLSAKWQDTKYFLRGPHNLLHRVRRVYCEKEHVNWKKVPKCSVEWHNFLAHNSLYLSVTWKKNIWIHEEKNLHFFSLCPLRPRKGGLKALAEMSAKNVSFFWQAPLMGMPRIIYAASVHLDKLPG